MKEDSNGYQIKILKFYKRWEKITSSLHGNTYHMRTLLIDLVKEFPFLKEHENDTDK